jgi:methionyl-tRNA formyltransferase
MKYIFFGTPEFSSLILEKLIGSGFAPAGVVCNPDRPVGRKKIITPPPTKVVALKHGIPVHQPASKEELNALAPKLEADFSVVAYYYQILSKEVLDKFSLGTIGVHYSFLPKYRGATPVQSAILAGDGAIGISLYLIDERLDHGPILAQKSVPISLDDTYLNLENKLTPIAGQMLVDLIPKFIKGEITPVYQDHDAATFTKKFATQDGFVDLNKDDPTIIERKVRALNPEPGVWTMKDGKRMKILKADVREGKLKLKEIQYEGGKPQKI